MIRFWYVRVPRALAPIAPRVAEAIADGGWTAVQPGVAAWAPVIVFIVALFAPQTWPGSGNGFANTFVFLAVAVALSIFSGTLGVAVLAAAVVRDALSHDLASSASALIHTGAARLIAWALLGVLVVLLPQFTHVATEAGIVRLKFLRNRNARAICRSVLLALIFPCLVFVWCEAASVLARPLVTWSGIDSTSEAATLLQTWGPWLAAVASIAAFARGIAEGIVAPRLHQAAAVETLTRERGLALRQAGEAWTAAPAALHVVVAVAAMTILLAGLFERAADGLFAGLVIGVFAVLARGLGGWLTWGWADLVRRVPGIIRVTLAVAVGALVTGRLTMFESLSSERVMLLGALLTLGMLFSLFPASHEATQNRSNRPVKVWR